MLINHQVYTCYFSCIASDKVSESVLQVLLTKSCIAKLTGTNIYGLAIISDLSPMPSQADMPLHVISVGRASFRLHRPPSCLDKVSKEQWKRLCLGDINRQPFWMKTCLSSLKQQQWETAQGYVWQMPCNRYHKSHLSVPVHCYIWTAFETRQNILFWQRNPEQN